MKSRFGPDFPKAFLSGTATINCDHAQMLRKARVPVLFTHHFRKVNPTDGTLMVWVSDPQVDQARRLIEAAGQRFEYHSFPEVGHFLHVENPALYAAHLASVDENPRTLPLIERDHAPAKSIARSTRSAHGRLTALDMGECADKEKSQRK
jgi:hypothetical protein